MFPAGNFVTEWKIDISGIDRQGSGMCPGAKHEARAFWKAFEMDVK